MLVVAIEMSISSNEIPDPNMSAGKSIVRAKDINENINKRKRIRPNRVKDPLQRVTGLLIVMADMFIISALITRCGLHKNFGSAYLLGGLQVIIKLGSRFRRCTREYWADVHLTMTQFGFLAKI